MAPNSKWNLQRSGFLVVFCCFVFQTLGRRKGGKEKERDMDARRPGDCIGRRY